MISDLFQAADDNTMTTEKDVSVVGEFLRCELCESLLSCGSNLSKLMNHAKRHCPQKQYSCPRCGYSSSERANVSKHLDRLHRPWRSAPLNKRTKAMEKAWIAVAKQCFPSRRDEFIAYHFKHIDVGPPHHHKPKGEQEPTGNTNDEQASSSNTSWKWTSSQPQESMEK